MTLKTMTLSLVELMLQCTWPEQYPKNVPHYLSGAIHLVRTYLMTNFLTASPLHAYVLI